MTTYTQIAAQAGVSIAAVSRAYTPGASVSSAMLGKISLAAKQLGHPLPPLPLVGLGLPPLEVGVIAGDVPIDWRPVLLDALNKAANHWNLQLHRLSPQRVREDPRTATKSIDGVLLLNGTMPLYQALEATGKPWLESLCLKEHQQQHQRSIVTIDHFAVGQWMADRLLQANYRQIYGVMAGAENPITKQICRGITNILRDSDLAWVLVQLPNAQQYTLQRWLDELDMIKQCGFCVFDDYVGNSLRRAIEQQGLLIPRDSGLLAFNHENSRLNDMSRLVIPLDDLMTSALELLRGHMIERDRLPELRLMPPREVIGSTHVVSTAAMAADDAVVSD